MLSAFSVPRRYAPSEADRKILGRVHGFQMPQHASDQDRRSTRSAGGEESAGTTDDMPFSDSTSELARGLDVVEIPGDNPPSQLSDPSALGRWNPMNAEEKIARQLGVQARRDGSLPNASPYEPNSLLDLCWLDGYRAGA